MKKAILVVIGVTLILGMYCIVANALEPILEKEIHVGVPEVKLLNPEPFSESADDYIATTMMDNKIIVVWGTFNDGFTWDNGLVALESDMMSKVLNGTGPHNLKGEELRVRAFVKCAVPNAAANGEPDLCAEDPYIVIPRVVAADCMPILPASSSGKFVCTISIDSIVEWDKAKIEEYKNDGHEHLNDATIKRLFLEGPANLTFAFITGKDHLQIGCSPNSTECKSSKEFYFHDLRKALAEPDDNKRKAVDADLDKIPDAYDNCPNISNVFQTDTDKDGVGNLCDKCMAKYDPSNKCTPGLQQPPLLNVKPIKPGFAILPPDEDDSAKDDEIDALKDALEKLKEELEAAQGEGQDKDTEMSELQDQIDRLQSELDGLQNQPVAPAESDTEIIPGADSSGGCSLMGSGI